MKTIQKQKCGHSAYKKGVQNKQNLLTCEVLFSRACAGYQLVFPKATFDTLMFYFFVSI